MARWRLLPPRPPVRAQVVHLDLGDGRVPFAIRVHPRARRITLRLALDGTGGMITLPPGATKADAGDLVRRHGESIRQRLASMPPRVPFDDGAIIPFRDEPHRIRHLPDRAQGCARHDGDIRVGGARAFIPRTLRRYLCAEARLALSERVADHASRARVRPSRICVRDTRSRWGSCAASGTLSFSWRLIMAPAHVLDYVAAHEVAHLIVPNHGPRFKELLDRLLAGPEEDGPEDGSGDAPAWLRSHGAGLHRYG